MVKVTGGHNGKSVIVQNSEKLQKGSRLTLPSAWLTPPLISANFPDENPQNETKYVFLFDKSIIQILCPHVKKIGVN